VVDPPRVVRLRTVAATDEDRLDFGEATEVAITQVYVVFDQAMADPAGDDDPDDVTNPANYLLLEPGPDGEFQTVDCATGADPGDVAVPTGPVTFLAEETTAAVVLTAGASLPTGRYRLHACGSTSLTSEDGTALDGDGDGEAGDDFVLDFVIEATNRLGEPNFDQLLADGGPWTVNAPAGALVEGSADDAGAAPTSGSARADNLGAAGELTLAQCIPVDGGEPHRFGARIRHESSSEEWPISWIRIEVFASSDCQPPSLLTDLLPLVDGASDSWLAFEEDLLLVEGAISARVTFGSTSIEGEAFETFWDDTFAGWDPSIFADGFESGDTTRWQ
jgi:hypothetical protein